jgi:hypothetical protein
MALASALRRLTEDEELRTRLGAAARHRAAALPTWEQTAERSFAAVSEAIGVRGHEKVPACGQVEVLAGGQLKVPTPRSPCRPGV